MTPAQDDDDDDDDDGDDDARRSHGWMFEKRCGGQHQQRQR